MSLTSSITLEALQINNLWEGFPVWPPVSLPARHRINLTHSGPYTPLRMKTGMRPIRNVDKPLQPILSGWGIYRDQLVMVARIPQAFSRFFCVDLAPHFSTVQSSVQLE